MKHPKLLESIRLQEGRYYNLPYHVARIQRACTALGIAHHSLPLTEFLQQITNPNKGLWKCRILYAERIEKIEFKAYKAKPIRSLKLVHANDISYSHKYEKREALSKLYAQRGHCDDIVIVKDNMLTDSYYGNIVLWKDGQWFTPDSPLLVGTQRASLLDSGAIQTRSIRVDDLKSFEKVKVINAMLDLERGPEVRVGDVVY